MPLLLKHQLTDGLIVGIWQSNSTALAQAQIVNDDPLYGYMLLSDLHHLNEIPQEQIQERWYISGTQTRAKTECTITATPNPFTADGTTVCSITVSPFVACTLMVNQEPYDLTTEDAILSLTSDTPMPFTVLLASQAQMWASPLLVEAT